MMRLTTSDSRRSSPRAAEKRRSILLWGAADSGKSGIIGALRSEGTKTVGDRWTIDLADSPPDVVAYADSSSLALRLRDVKETAIRRPERAFTAPVKRYAGRTLTTVADLTVLDPRGDLADDPTSASARRALSAARTADGILWLIEVPTSGGVTATRRLAVLRQVIAFLDAASMTAFEVPVVIALSKVDRLPRAEMQRLIDAPETALRGLIGDAAFGWLLAAFPRLRCVGLTSAGTVRNVARPVGLTTMLDWFGDEWRREELAADSARTRARRSARVARVRRRAPLATAITGGVAIIAFAGVAAARLLTQKNATWTTSAGAVVTPATPTAPADTITQVRTADTTHGPSVASAAATLEHGDAIGALRELGALRLTDSSSQHFVVDSLIAAAALRGAEEVLSSASPSATALQTIVSATSAAIARAHPGTPMLAPLSLARAAACIGGQLNCPAEEVREDLAWALLLGNAAEQDQARRLRAALVGDSVQMR